MADKSKARILVIDDDPDVGRDLAEIFQARGYEVFVAPGVGETLRTNAIALAEEVRPHVAIIDMRLNDDFGEDNRGLSLYAKLKSALCIIYSSYIQIRDTRTIKQIGFHAWVNKNESPKALVGVVFDAAAHTSAQAAGFSVQWPNADAARQVLATLLEESVPLSADLWSDLLTDLLFQLRERPDAHSVAISRLDHAEGPLSPASRGESVVLRAAVDGADPRVLKLTSSAATQLEARHFKRHIENRLGGDYHTRLISSTVFWDVGGSLYSLVGAGMTPPVSFSAAYSQTDDVTALVTPLEHFFGIVWRHHYRPSKPLPSASLETLYGQRTLKVKKKAAQISPKMLADVLDHVEWELIDPVSYLLDGGIGHGVLQPVKQRITHGDLHGDNIFVDGDHTWVIDFGRTGPGYWLRDFVELEMDIFTRLCPIEQPAHQSRFAAMTSASITALVSGTRTQLPPNLQGDPDLVKAVAVVDQVRDLAKTCAVCASEKSTQSGDPYGLPDYVQGEYMLALIYNCLFVAGMRRVEPSQKRRALIYAGQLAARHQSMQRAS